MFKRRALGFTVNRFGEPHTSRTRFRREEFQR